MAHEPGLLGAPRRFEDQPFQPRRPDQRVDELVTDRAVRPVEPGVAGDAALADDRVRPGVQRLARLADPQLGRGREPPVLAADLDDLANDLVASDNKLGREGSPAARDGVVVLPTSASHNPTKRWG